MLPDRPARVLIGACGAGTVVNLPDYLGEIREHTEAEIRVVMTATAANLMPPRTIELFCDAVLSPGATPSDRYTNHVELARWADRIIILPATAHMIGVVAAGQAPNLLASTLLAHAHPVTFFPSMNPILLSNAAVKRNLAQLRADGHLIVPPVVGSVYEAATRKRRQTYTVPPPKSVSAYVRRILAVKLTPRAEFTDGDEL